MPNIVLGLLSLLIQLGYCQEYIFVAFSKENFACLSKNTCDGSQEKPFGSLLEGINYLFKSSKNTTLYLLDDVYNYEKSEAEWFISEGSPRSTIFEKEGGGNQIISLEGYELQGAISKNRKKILFNDQSYFSLIFGSFTLRVVNIYFDFWLLIKLPNSFGSFLKIKQSKSSYLELIGCVFDLGRGSSLSKPSVQGILLDLDEANSTTFISQCQFILNSQSFMNALLNARNSVESTNSQFNSNTSFENCLFSGGDKISTLQIIIQNGRISFEDCNFSEDILYLTISVENSLVYFNRIIFELMYSGEENGRVDIGCFLLANNSEIYLNNSVLKGNPLYFDTVVPKMNFIVAKRLNRIFVQDFNISDVKLRTGFALESENELVLMNIIVSSFSRMLCELGKGNKLKLGSSKIFGCNNNEINSKDNKGSVLYSEEANEIMIENSEFTKNSADLGGVFYLNTLTQLFIINKSKFLQNRAMKSGGVLYLNNTNKKLHITGSTFASNEAKQSGGVLYANMKNREFSISDSVFLENKALDGNFGNGAVVYLNTSNGVFVLRSSYFFMNEAQAGILFQSTENKNLSVFNCVFNKNRLEYGVIFFYNLNSNIILFKCIFSSNLGKATISGSALYIFSVHLNLTIADCVFYDGEGGFLDIGSTHNGFLLVNSLFFSSKAEYFGGVMAMEQGHQNVTVIQCLISGNIATAGGFLWVDSNNNYFTLIQNAIISTYALNDNLESGLTDVTGGALHFGSFNSDLVVIGCVFMNCAAVSASLSLLTGGGVLFFEDSNNQAVILNSLFHSCFTNLMGGVFYIRGLYNNDFTVMNSTICSSSAIASGAVLHLGAANSNIRFINMEIFNSSGAYLGGVIYADNICVNLVFMNLRINFSNAQQLGGILYGHLMVTNVSFVNVEIYNVNTNKSGAVFSMDIGGQLNMQDSKIENISSALGTVITTEASAKISFLNTIIKNISTVSGAGFDLGTQNLLNFSNSKIYNFKSARKGQAIFRLILVQTNMTFENCYFDKIVHFIMEQLSHLNIISFKRCIFVFSENYTEKEIFVFDSKYTQFILVSNIFRQKTLDKLTTFVTSTQAFSKLTMDGNEIDINDYTVFINLLNTLEMNLVLKSFKITTTGANLLYLNGVYSNSLSISVKDSIFLLKQLMGHFFNLNAGSSLMFQQCQFFLSREIRFSLIYYSKGLVNTSPFKNNITFEKTLITMFFSSPEDPQLNLNKISSEFGLLHIFENLEKIELNDCHIQIGKSLLSSILRIHENVQTLWLKGSLIQFNLLNNQSHLIFLENILNTTVRIENCSIRNNRVVYGGLFSINSLGFLTRKLDIRKVGFDVCIIIVNTSIRNNYAVNRGGIIFINGTNMNKEDPDQLISFLNSSLVIDQISILKGNRAPFGSFIFIEGKFSPGLTILNELLVNKLIKMPEKNRFSTDLHIFDVLDSMKTVLKTKKVESSFKVKRIIVDDFRVEPNYFCFALYDDFNQTGQTESQTEIKANIANLSLVSKIVFNQNIARFTMNVKFYKGFFCVDTFHFLDKNEYFVMMGKIYKVNLSVEILKPFFSTLDNTTTSPITIEFEIIDCPIASFYNGSSCMFCPRNSYQNEKIDSLYRCVQCKDTNHFNCYGASYRSPKENFWRMNNRSEVFLRCPYTSCKGDLSFLKNETENYCSSCTLPTSKGEQLIYSYDEYYTALGDCAPGYTGSLCAQCIPGFGSTGKYRCADCSHGMIYVKQIILLIVKLGLFLFTNWKGIQSKIDDTQDKNSKKFIDNLSSSYLLKTISTYFNYVALIKYLPFEIDPSFEEAFGSFTNISPTENFEIFSFECFLKMLKIGLKPVFFQTLFIIGFGLSTFLLLLIAFLKKKKKALAIKLTTVMKKYFKAIALIFFVNNIVLFLDPFVGIIMCINLGDDKNQRLVLLSEFTENCLSGEHRSFLYILAVPVIITLGGLVPLYLLYSLCQAIILRKLNDEEFKLNFGYFSFPYKPEAAFYEVVAIFGKICIIIFREAFILFVVYNNQTSILLIFLLYLMIQLALLNYLSPYNPANYSALQSTDSLSLKVSMSNTIVALIWSLLGNAYDTASSQFILLIYAIVTNALFLLFWGSNYFRFLKEKVAEANVKFKVFSAKLKQKLNKTQNSLRDPQEQTQKDEKIPAKSKIISETEKLRKENINLNLLTKLLLEQVAGLESRLFDFDEGEVKAASIKLTPARKHTKEKRPSKYLDECSSSPKDNLLIAEEREMKSENLGEKNLNDSPKIIALKSQKLRGKAFTDCFIVFKFERIVEKEVKIDISFSDKEWLTACFEGFGDKFTYLALKKLIPWSNPPFSRTIDLTLKIRGDTHLLQENLSLSDFVEVLSIRWSEVDAIQTSRNVKFVTSKILDDGKCAALFESHKPPEKTILHGSASVRMLISDIEEKKLYLQLSRGGTLNIYCEGSSSLVAETGVALIKFIVRNIS